MPASLFRVDTGFSINEEADILYGAVDPSSGGGVTAPPGSMYMQNASGADGGELWIKKGDADTGWEKAGGDTSTEIGYIRAFIGKTGAGNELPDYSSTNVVSDDDNLEVAIGKLDAEIGAGVTANARTNNPISDQAINLNIEALDDAIGTDAQMSNLNYIAVANSVNENLSALDGQVKTNTDAISALSAGYRMIEKVKVVTGDDISSKSGTAVTFSDDNTGGISLSVGDRIASVNSASNDNIYIVQSGAWTTVTLTEKDAFYTDYNLPDTEHQEGLALYYYDGTDIILLADFDFETADSIALATPYAPTNGTIVAGDTVQKAIGNLDANQLDLITLSGVAKGAVDLGTFSGTTIADNETVKGALQDLEDGVEANDGEISDLEDAVGSSTGLPGLTYTEENYVADGQSLNASVDALDIGLGKARKESSANGVTTEVTLDEVTVDDWDCVKWIIKAVEVANPENKEAMEILAIHDGEAGADATKVDFTKYAKLRTTKITGFSVDVDINGTGGAQTMRLRVSSTDSCNVSVIRAVV